MDASLAGLGLIITIIIFAVQQWKSNKLLKFNIYQNLELEANQVFRFSAEKHNDIYPFMSSERIGTHSGMENFIDNYFYQTLNLLELAANYRTEKMLDPHVYAGWVEWYYETLESWYFRESWEQIRPHYTKSLRDIFDKPVKTFDATRQQKRREIFFKHVSKAINRAEFNRNKIPKYASKLKFFKWCGRKIMRAKLRSCEIRNWIKNCGVT